MMTPKAKHELRHLTYAAVCLALALILPLVTGNIPRIGRALCPMHLPVLLCGFVAGPWWGLAVGLAAPPLRHLLFAMPPYPTFAAMALELGAYGLVSGLLYKHLPRRTGYIYLSLLAAMALGRIVSGAAMAALLGLGGQSYSFAAFIAANVTGAVPGLIAQILLVPVIVLALEKAGIAHKHLH